MDILTTTVVEKSLEEHCDKSLVTCLPVSVSVALALSVAYMIQPLPILYYASHIYLLPQDPTILPERWTKRTLLAGVPVLTI
jgi:hypothetical protein